MEPEIRGTLDAPDDRRQPAKGKTFVFTSMQNNTKLHESFWASLLQFCEHREAELHVSRFTYIKSGKSVNEKVTAKGTDGTGVWFDPRTADYWSDESLQVAPGLMWCGDLNILPTKAHPVTGFETFGRENSIIIPHAKMAMQSIPTMKFCPAKFAYSTGAVTLRNYIQRTAGQRADFHHVFGAIVVEVDDAGHWWARQLNADKAGGFYDTQWYYNPEGVQFSVAIEAITHGDLHGLKLDRSVAEAVWGKGGVVDSLFPKFQFFHDSIDVTARNHHNIRDHLFWHDMFSSGTQSVEQEFDVVATFLCQYAHRDWCKSYCVLSNHDMAFGQWLRNPATMFDPPNLKLWLQANLYCVSEHEQHKTPHPFIWLMQTKMREHRYPRKIWPGFIKEDESFTLHEDIECGVHGHLGPNGARGSPKSLRSIGKANTGHTHSAGIVDGVYTAGTYSQLDMGYNKGPSSWSHSCVVTYVNGKRAVYTIKNGKAWR